MADARVEKAWRDWKANSVPDYAQVYCTEVSRAGQQPCGATSIKGMDLDTTYRDGLQVVIAEACRRYLGQDIEDTMVEELHWITECHYWVCSKASPSILRSIRKLYSDHGMELLPGDEDQATQDLDRLTSRPRQREAYAELRQEIAQLQRKLADCESKLENAERSEKFQKRENARLRGQVDLLKKYEADAHKHAGMEAINATLKRENERLAAIIQGRKAEA